MRCLDFHCLLILSFSDYLWFSIINNLWTIFRAMRFGYCECHFTCMDVEYIYSLLITLSLNIWYIRADVFENIPIKLSNCPSIWEHLQGFWKRPPFVIPGSEVELKSTSVIHPRSSFTEEEFSSLSQILLCYLSGTVTSSFSGNHQIFLFLILYMLCYDVGTSTNIHLFLIHCPFNSI